MMGAGERFAREIALSRSHAWHVATLSRSKRIPDHDKVTGENRPPPRAQGRQSPDQLDAQGMALAAAWGVPIETIIAVKGAS